MSGTSTVLLYRGSASTLTGADLRGVSLAEADLKRADFSEADLSGADLTLANLAEARLTRAHLIFSNLTTANLSHTNLAESDLTYLNLNGADLSEADFSRAILAGTAFSDVDLSVAKVQAARERKDKEHSTIRFPVRIDDAVMDAHQPWAADLRRTRHIGDFRNRQNHASYKAAFDRLLRDLQSSKNRWILQQ